MNKAIHNNALSIAMFALFLVSFAGQTISGHRVFNEDRTEHREHPVSLGEYVRTGHFAEATFENWESEFLQMAAFVLLTAWLIQKGSSESKKPGEGHTRKEDRQSEKHPRSPWPVHRGGLALKLYEHSLSGALFIFFIISFLLHAAGGAREQSRESVQHGGDPVSLLDYLGTSRLWFESFQNWQSEFFSIWALLLLTIYLRERGSPQSKPVTASHSKTGDE